MFYKTFLHILLLLNKMLKNFAFGGILAHDIRMLEHSLQASYQINVYLFNRLGVLLII